MSRNKDQSKYVEFGTMGFSEFARQSIGTEVKYMLATEVKARHHVSKSLKSACSKAGSLCEISCVSVLVEQDNGSWLPTSILTAKITEERIKGGS
ncbi:hypothetical protein [Neptuniibacter sp. QD37_11]|uniref:hypothetical protein n=1 Tax=Neptuniibacter sp. QD37_11 TaxID=3398209 RepID=UPI0039F598E8